MKRETMVELVMFGALVAAGVFMRVSLHENYPNFAPVAAIALFAGYFFRSKFMAVAMPVSIMALSNLLIEDGGYQYWTVMFAVYGCLAAPVACRALVRKIYRPGSSWRQAAASLLGLLACAAGSSVLFFTVTNFAHWAVTDMYPHSLAGLATCYAQALVFFWYTLAGDMCFASLLFGGYVLARELAPLPVLKPKTAVQYAA